jgi:hypothetical protein
MLTERLTELCDLVTATDVAVAALRAPIAGCARPDGVTK